METYTLQNARCCDTLIAGTYEGRHYTFEDEQFNFATPNSFLNHFNENNPLFATRDLIVNFNTRTNQVVVVADLHCKRTNTSVIHSVSAPTIPAAFVSLLIKMDI
jgi:hypothetical protein